MADVLFPVTDPWNDLANTLSVAFVLLAVAPAHHCFFFPDIEKIDRDDVQKKDQQDYKARVHKRESKPDQENSRVDRVPNEAVCSSGDKILIPQGIVTTAGMSATGSSVQENQFRQSI